MTANPTRDGAAAREAQETKTRLVSLTEKQIADLGLCYSYRRLQAQVSNLGWTNIFLGVLTVWLGVDDPGVPPFKIVQTLLGVAIVLVSRWSIKSPRPAALSIWALLFVVIGVWNIFIAVEGQSLLWGAFGLLQLWWAYRMYRTFVKNAQAIKPDAEALRRYGVLRRAIGRLDIQAENDPDFFRLRHGRYWWQGLFLKDRIALAPKKGQALLIADSSQTTFTFSEGWSGFAPRIVGHADIGKTSMKKVTIPQTTLERYNRWKGLPDSQTSAWLDAFYASARRRLPIRIVLALVMAAPLLFLVFLAVYALLIVATYGNLR